MDLSDRGIRSHDPTRIYQIYLEIKNQTFCTQQLLSTADHCKNR